MPSCAGSGGASKARHVGDPWADASVKFTAGSQVEGPILSFTKFGAFVQLAEGIEGMIHVSELVSEKRVDRPQDVLRTGQIVKAKVLAVDKEKRQLKLSMKQLIPTGLDEYIAEHNVGDTVTGRLIEVSGEQGTVELGDGIHAQARLVLEKLARSNRFGPFAHMQPKIIGVNCGFPT